MSAPATPFAEQRFGYECTLRLAEAGVPMFPCAPNKRPLVAGGFKAATSELNQIFEWRSRHPTSRIGVPTGLASGLWVLDADVDKRSGEKIGEETAAAFGLRDYPFRASTRSGGVHYFFRHEEGLPRNSTKVLPGLDVRGEGGYVVAWDPEVILAAVADAPPPPEKLVAALRRRPDRGASKRQTSSNPDRASEKTPAWARRAFDAELAKIVGAPEGARNETLNAAAFAVGQILAGGHLDTRQVEEMLMRAGRSTALPEAEVRRTIDHALADARKYPRTSNKRRPAPPLVDVEAGEFLISEDSVAREFSRQHVGKFLHDHDLGRWLTWSSTHWAEDKEGFVFDCVRLLARELAQSSVPRIRVMAGRSGFVSGAQKFAASDPTFARKSDVFDSDPWIIGTPAGVVDLKTSVLRPAAHEDMVTKITSVAPAARSDCTTWKKFLDDATGEDGALIRFLQQWLGYCLTGVTREHALVFVYGSGGNGKSVFLNAVSEILGDYAEVASMDVFTSGRFDRHPTELAMLRGARVVTASETEGGRAWAEARIKQLTGGDKITARFMRQDFFTYRPQFKLTIVGNHEPELKNIDAAAERRFNIVPFTRQPLKPDRELADKLRAEYPAILRWMLEGCLDWQAHGLLRPEAVTAATAEYFDGQDLLGQWLNQKCDLLPGDHLKREAFGQLFNSWSVFAKAAGEEPGSGKSFSAELTKRGAKSHKGSAGVRYMLGIALKKSARGRRDADSIL